MRVLVGFTGEIEMITRSTQKSYGQGINGPHQNHLANLQGGKVNVHANDDSGTVRSQQRL